MDEEKLYRTRLPFAFIISYNYDHDVIIIMMTMIDDDNNDHNNYDDHNVWR